MKIVDPGHHYRLDLLDAPDLQSVVFGADLVFVKREGEGYPGNVGHYSGTNMQEVLRALIDRVKYLNNQIPHPRNDNVITSLRHAIFNLELRAAERHGRLDEFTSLIMRGGPQIENFETCKKCGHIGCEGRCHS